MNVMCEEYQNGICRRHTCVHAIWHEYNSKQGTSCDATECTTMKGTVTCVPLYGSEKEEISVDLKSGFTEE